MYLGKLGRYLSLNSYIHWFLCAYVSLNMYIDILPMYLLLFFFKQFSVFIYHSVLSTLLCMPNIYLLFAWCLAFQLVCHIHIQRQSWFDNYGFSGQAMFIKGNFRKPIWLLLEHLLKKINTYIKSECETSAYIIRGTRNSKQTQLRCGESMIWLLDR